MESCEQYPKDVRSAIDASLEVKRMDRDIFSYTGDGKNDMDKTNHLPQYSRGNQILTVERHFSDTTTLHEALKQYISERWRKERLDTPETGLCNRSGNTTAVASTEKDGMV